VQNAPNEVLVKSQEAVEPLDMISPGLEKGVVLKSLSQGWVEHMKKEHDLAKAVKSDDVEVPTHLWNDKVCRGPATPHQAACLYILRTFFLRVYRQRLLTDYRRVLRRNHGRKWTSMRRWVNITLNSDLEALRDIMWRTSVNSWFEYPGGSRLMYWRFPAKYQRQARDRVPVYFIEEGPTPMRVQSIMKPAEAEVLRAKILKVIQKRYLVVPTERLKSVISYFGVPKGVIDGIIQDWRTVYHDGANGLNDKVWASSFWLPGVNSLARMLDLTSVMEDQDIGEMFLNFELHPMVRKFAGVDVGPLGFSKEECASWWLCWVKNLMSLSR